MYLGSMNQELNKLEAFEKQLAMATSMLVFMVRGLFIDINFPYAQFPCSSLNASILYPIVWDVVRHLQLTGFKVLALTADGASCNRAFFQMHSIKKAELVHKVQNPFTDECWHIFFFSDVPHFIKTSQNAFTNPFAHSETRKL